MTDRLCPNCGKDLPSELGQHSLAPISGLVVCPHCGAEVHVQKVDAASAGDEKKTGAPGGRERSTGPGEADAGHKDRESFSGHETVEGVMEEIREKQE